MEFVLETKKFGKQVVLVDAQDSWLLTQYRWYLWSTKRHSGIYVVASESNKNPKQIHYKRLHQLILKADAGQIVDHVNGNPLDNRRKNLRITNSSGNNKNAGKRRNSKGKFKGVHYSTREKKFKAQVQCDGKKINLGTYLSEVEAAKAYDIAALQYFGEFARLNFPQENT